MAIPAASARARRRERGAIHVASAAGILVGVLAASLAIDVGSIAFSRRDLQRTVDLAALDVMRAVGECAGEGGDPVEAARASALRNGYAIDFGAPPNRVQVGRVRTVGGVRELVPLDEPAMPDGAEVAAGRAVSGLIGSAFRPLDVRVRAVGVAQQRALAGLRVGSFGASIDSTRAAVLDAVLGGLLGSEVSLDAVSYQAIADGSVTLGALVEQDPTIGSTEEFLEGERDFADYLELLEGALDAQGDADAASAVGDLAGQLAGGGSFAAGDLIDVEPGAGDDADSVALSAFDLVTMGAQIATGDHAVVVDSLGLSLPGVAEASLRMRIVEPPRIAIGPPGRDEDGAWRTRVRTAQVRAEIELAALSAVALLGGSGIRIPIYLELAQTEGRLEAIRCARAADPTHAVTVGVEPGVTHIGIGEYPDLETSPAPLPAVIVSQPLPLLGTLAVVASADVAIAGDGESLVFEGPFPPRVPATSPHLVQTVGTPLGESVSGAVADLAGSLELTVQGPLPLGVPAGLLLSQVGAIAGPLVGTADLLVEPLLRALGVHLGGADVSVFGVVTTAPTLVR